jgi:hypothetical protein
MKIKKGLIIAEFNLKDKSMSRAIQEFKKSGFDEIRTAFIEGDKK